MGRFYFVGNKTKEKPPDTSNDMTPMYIRVILKRSTMRTYRFRREHVKNRKKSVSTAGKHTWHLMKNKDTAVVPVRQSRKG